jgi:hypothetical protein
VNSFKSLFVSIRKQTSFVHVLFTIIATDADRNNPNYTDPCVDANGGYVCSYCCNVMMTTCSRDIRACNPVYNRDFWELSLMVAFISSVTIGCPLIALLLKCLI